MKIVHIPTDAALTVSLKNNLEVFIFAKKGKLCYHIAVFCNHLEILGNGLHTPCTYSPDLLALSCLQWLSIPSHGVSHQTKEVIFKEVSERFKFINCWIEVG